MTNIPNNFGLTSLQDFARHILGEDTPLPLPSFPFPKKLPLSSEVPSLKDRVNLDSEIEELFLELALKNQPDNSPLSELLPPPVMADNSELIAAREALEAARKALTEKFTHLTSQVVHTSESEKQALLQATDALIQKEKALNERLQADNTDLNEEITHLRSQLEGQEARFIDTAHLIQKEVTRQLAEGEDVQKDLQDQITTLSSQVNNLSRDNARLTRENAHLQEELATAASDYASDLEHRSNSSEASLEDLRSSHIEEVYTSDPHEDQDSLPIYKDLMSQISSNLQEFQGTPGANVQDLLKMLQQLVQRAP